MGESAGGHLALLYGYLHPEQISKIISMSGPADFYSDIYLKNKYFKRSHKMFKWVTGAKYDDEQSREKFREASPIANVSPVPTLIFQGNKDYMVNESQGKALDSVLREKGYPQEFVYMKGSGHVPRISNRKFATSWFSQPF